MEMKGVLFKSAKKERSSVALPETALTSAAGKSANMRGSPGRRYEFQYFALISFGFEVLNQIFSLQRGYNTNPVAYRTGSVQMQMMQSSGARLG